MTEQEIVKRRPLRVQRTRQNKTISPNGLIVACVTRPGIFGNPYDDVKKYGIDLCLKMFENTCRGHWDPLLLKDLSDEDVHWFYEKHWKWSKRCGGYPLELIKQELKGKNLACWCKLSDKCHADILLRLANE
jgi:hypothetical protein